MNETPPLQCRENTHKLDEIGNRVTRLETKFENGINTRMKNVEEKLESLSNHQMDVRLEIAKGMGRHAFISVLFQGVGAAILIFIMSQFGS